MYLLCSLALAECLILVVFGSGVPLPSSLSSTHEEMPVRQMPMVQNFFGAAYLRRDNGPGFGLAGIGPVTLSPYDVTLQNSSFFFNGAPVPLTHTKGWGGGEAFRFANSPQVNVTNSVTMLFETYTMVQRWSFNNTINPAARARMIERIEDSVVNMVIDGPYARSCEEYPPCGWGFHVPVDRDFYSVELLHTNRLNLSMVLSSDSISSAVTASVVWVEGGTENSSVTVQVNSTGKNYNVAVSHISPETRIYFCMTVAPTSVDAVTAVENALLAPGGVEGSWKQSNRLWQARWESAFSGPTASTSRRLQTSNQSLNSAESYGAPSSDVSEDGHFSGGLPLLVAPGFPEVERLYYWAALALVSLERTNLLSATRNFVVSEGPSNAYDGSSGMGGSGQFTWDLSFASLSYSLLDPTATQRILMFIISHSNVDSSLMLIPQCWDAYPAPEKFLGGVGTYVFDYVAAFVLIHQYTSLSNATAFMTSPVVLAKKHSSASPASVTPLNFIRALAWAWKEYPRWNASESPYITEYGDDKRLFLEAVPTYMGAVAGLQFANAGMLLAYARALETYAPNSPDTASEAQHARGNATAIVADTLRLQLVPDSGFFRCLYRNGSSASVRSIADYNYLGVSLGLLGRDIASLLPDAVRELVVRFFYDGAPCLGRVGARSVFV
jgi:hypothetical protein